MLDGRKRNAARALVASTFAITLVSVGLATGPAGAAPTPESVQAKVKRLYHQAEVASEQLNNANAQVSAAKTTMTALNSDFVNEQKTVNALREQVASIVVSQYQGQSLSAASQVALSGNPSTFIQGMNVMTGVNSQRADVLNRYTVELQRLQLRKQAVASEAQELKAAQAKAATERKRIEDATTQAENQLATLRGVDRATVVRDLSGGSYSASMPSVSGMAAIAVRYALAQVGKRYVFGAAGPNAFDCSGLTMAAWGVAGVALPHFAAAQLAQGTRIPASEMRPGDLVFYYGGVSHVGMYIGNGMIVNAQNPSAGVRIVPWNSMPVSGIARVG